MCNYHFGGLAANIFEQLGGCHYLRATKYFQPKLTHINIKCQKFVNVFFFISSKNLISGWSYLGFILPFICIMSFALYYAKKLVSRFNFTSIIITSSNSLCGIRRWFHVKTTIKVFDYSICTNLDGLSLHQADQV